MAPAQEAAAHAQEAGERGAVSAPAILNRQAWPPLPPQQQPADATGPAPQGSAPSGMTQLVRALGPLLLAAEDHMCRCLPPAQGQNSPCMRQTIKSVILYIIDLSPLQAYLVDNVLL